MTDLCIESEARGLSMEFYIQQAPRLQKKQSISLEDARQKERLEETESVRMCMCMCVK